MADTALKVKKLEIREAKNERIYNFANKLFDTAKEAATSPIGLMVTASVANQVLYNAGLFNPHDPYHSEEEDWAAGGAVSDWLFFATLTVSACMAAKTAADIIPSLSDVI